MLYRITKTHSFLSFLQQQQTQMSLFLEAQKLTEKGFQSGVAYKKAGVCLFMLVSRQCHSEKFIRHG
jgi:hypothetical protein